MGNELDIDKWGFYNSQEEMKGLENKHIFKSIVLYLLIFSP